MLLGVRRHGQGYAVGEVRFRMRHSEPAGEIRPVHHVRSPREAAATLVSLLALSTEAPAPAPDTPQEDTRMQLSMLERNPSPEELQTRKAKWLSALRAQVLLHYRGREVTTDDIWRLMEHAPDLRIPDGMSSNVLGTFFVGWPHAHKTGGYRRSERDGAHSNLLTVWKIAP